MRETWKPREHLSVLTHGALPDTIRSLLEARALLKRPKRRNEASDLGRKCLEILSTQARPRDAEQLRGLSKHL